MGCERVCVPCDGGEADRDADDDDDDADDDDRANDDADDESPSETNCVLMRSVL